MSIELHSFTVELSGAKAMPFRSMAEHRAWVRKAVADLSQAVRASGMESQAHLRGHDGNGCLLVEATDTGAAFLRGLPAVLRVGGHAAVDAPPGAAALG